MSQMILKAKLQKPAMPAHLINNNKIVETFGDSQIIIISAQAGSGKSTLASRWLDTQNAPFIWYSLDEWDNSLSQFLLYIAAGLSEIDSHVSGQMLQLLESRQTIDEDMLIRAYVSLLLSTTHPFTLVLDDYHKIDDQMIHSFMRALIEHLPRHIKLCVISREDPPLPLAKLRLQRNVTELRMADLRFTRGDAEALLTSYLNKSLTNALTQEQLDQIYARTEGWVSGLMLLAFTMQDSKDVDHFLQSFGRSQRYVMDYLLEEVLERQSEAVKAFLLMSSIFEYFSAEQCDEVLSLKPGESAGMIDALVKSNSFLVTLEGDEAVYRYHHLFRALLLKRFEAAFSNSGKRLYERAGDWFRQAGRLGEATAYYLKGGCVDAAAAIIEKLWLEMDLSLQSGRWLEMAKALPADVFEKSPVLAMGYGWSLLDSGDTVGCLPWFEKARTLYARWRLGASDDLDASNGGVLVHNLEELEQMPATLMSAEAYIAAVHGDYEVLAVKAEALRRLADSYTYNRRWQIETFLATAQWGNGALQPALEGWFRVLDETRGGAKHLSPLVQNSFKWVISELYIQMGQLTKAELLIQDAVDEVRQKGIVPVMLGTYYLYLATIAAYRGAFDLAFERLEASMAYGQQFGFVFWRYKYYVLKARLYIAEGLLDSAKLCVEEGKRHVFHHPIPESFTIDDMDLWLKLSQETDQRLLVARVEEILGFVDGASGNGLSLPSYTDELKWKLAMRYMPVDRSSDKMASLCGKLITRAMAQKRWLSVIEFTLLQMRFVTGKEEREALKATAIRLAEEEGIKLPFIEFGESVISVDGSSARRKSDLANRSLSEPLTSRELELLRLIAAGLSNQEIANTLFIALSTVKSYNNSLFGKLEVSRRTEAVAKAKLLGLI